jgi:hypothetical protein
MWAARGALIGILMCAASGRADPAAAADMPTGRALFDGEAELHGRIYGHKADLPPAVVRCANCHAVAAGPEVPQSLAPRLTRDLLMRPLSRRGGPPTRYDAASFCTLLRRGTDPAYVLISVEMPRYAIDADDCRALWRFLAGEHARETIEAHTGHNP